MNRALARCPIVILGPVLVESPDARRQVRIVYRSARKMGMTRHDARRLAQGAQLAVEAEAQFLMRRQIRG
jgi:hypothetical protein